MKRKNKKPFISSGYKLDIAIPAHKTKKCSIADVCEGKPLPDNLTYFYKNSSACISCLAKKTKEKWAEKKNNLFF